MAASSAAPPARLTSSHPLSSTPRATTTPHQAPHAASSAAPQPATAQAPAPPPSVSGSSQNNHNHNHTGNGNPGERAQGYYLPSSFLAPRMAVALNVSKPWHFVLFACRLLSISPAVAWGWPSTLLLLDGLISSVVEGRRWAFAETVSALACIWCLAAGYLSFFFTDCLMSRWLINYTPQATIVRLLTINAVNAYVTSGVLTLLGGFLDPRLLLPGWIGISTTLTIAYHITHQQINIRKETSTSINVFSIASFLSMVALLALLYTSQGHRDLQQCPLQQQSPHEHQHEPQPPPDEFPEIPLFTIARLLLRELRNAAERTKALRRKPDEL